MSKKQKTSEELSPADAYFERLHAKENEIDAKGSMLIVGIQSQSEDESEDENEEEQQDLSKYTADQVSRMRHVLITERRAAELENGTNFATGGQAGDGFMMFNTSHGNEIIFELPDQIKQVKKLKSAGAQFDRLFGLTHGLQAYDVWIHDNECWMDGSLDKAVKLLASTWKALLAKGDQELEIDAEFSRPGVEAFLQQFADTISSSEAVKAKFKWK